MKTFKLRLETKINAILIVDKKYNHVFMSTDLNTTLLEWMNAMGVEGQFPQGYVVPNLLSFNLKYECDGSNPLHKMTSYLYDDKNYRIFVNVFDNQSN